MQQKIIYLTPVGMEVYISKPIYDGEIPAYRPKFNHSHLCWELLYYKDKGAKTFTLTNSFKSNTYSVEMTAARAGRQVYCIITDQYGNKVQTDTATLGMK